MTLEDGKVCAAEVVVAGCAWLFGTAVACDVALRFLVAGAVELGLVAGADDAVDATWWCCSLAPFCVVPCFPSSAGKGFREDALPERGTSCDAWEDEAVCRVDFLESSTARFPEPISNISMSTSLSSA